MRDGSRQADSGTAEERAKVERTLDDLGLTGHRDVVLIDARDDNKPSASKATSVGLA